MKVDKLAKLAKKATHEAFERALENGNSVMIARGGKLLWIHPDRTVEFIKAIKPPLKIKKGTKIKLK